MGVAHGKACQGVNFPEQAQVDGGPLTLNGLGHLLLLLCEAKVPMCEAKVPNCQKNKAFKDLGHYAAWPKVADAAIKACG
jgi:hypothetical protein